MPIAHIAGLNNFSIPTPMVVKPDATRRSLAVPSVQGSGPSSAYLPRDMRAAYYGGSALTGAGQTVALVQFDGYDIQDVVSAFAGGASATTDAKGNYVLTYKPAASGPTYTIPINNVLLDGATRLPGQLFLRQTIPNRCSTSHRRSGWRRA